MKIRDLYIDADHLLYNVAGNKPKDSLEGEVLEVEVDMEPLRLAYLKAVDEITDSVALEVVAKKFKLGKTYLVFSDPVTNFRYEIFPDYKKGRVGRKMSDSFYKLRDWAHGLENAIVGQNVEADDIVAHYVRKGAVGVSTDKDLLSGVPGRWFDNYHARRSYRKVGKKEAEHFVLLQTLAGDSTDGIPGIPRVGMKTAENLLLSNGESWEGVVTSYLNAGLTVDDAILTRRLVDMTQWSPKKGVQLWQP